MKTTLLSCFLLALGIQLHAQIKLSGTIMDNQVNPIPFTTVLVLELPSTGAFSDDNGKFSITLPDSLLNKEIHLAFNMIGYVPDTSLVRLDSNYVYTNIILEEALMLLDAIVVQNVAAKSAGVVSTNESGFRFKGKKERNNVQYSPLSIASTPSTEEYANSPENSFLLVNKEPVTTMSIDVDNASYANVRRFINQGVLPPADAVRVEEMINYFSYQYPQTSGSEPYTVYTELAPCPWNPQHQLLHIGMRGKTIEAADLPPANFVFLIDVSGSMGDANKLSMVKSSMKMLVRNLRDEDRVAIVTYSTTANVALQSTKCVHRNKIIEAIDALVAAGSTAGADGIQKAYAIAKDNYLDKGNNRVILCTDGDFNVGVSTPDELEALITKQKENGIFLTCLGYGMGNLKDNRIERLADKGDGNYGYIDNMQEASKLLVEAFGSTMYTVAKDMKVQIEFNPTYTAAYRLIGYENRMLENEDFENDAVDGGELGAGQSVTALYEIIPVGVEDTLIPNQPKLKYQQTAPTDAAYNNEIATIKVRYKEPIDANSTETVFPIVQTSSTFEGASEDFRFASAVAMYGMLLSESKYLGSTNVGQITGIAAASKGDDIDGYRAEFVRLVKSTSEIQ